MHSDQQVRRVLGLVGTGHSDSAIALLTGIPRRTVSDWRRGKNLLRPRGLRGDGVCEGHDFSVIPSREYSYLLGLYLGDGYISKGQRGVWHLRITLDSAYTAIVDECCVALEALFPQKKAHRGFRRNSRCVDVSMWSKHWPCLIPQHGLGRKHLRDIHLEEWQQKIVAANRRPFIRGLIHSDGTRITATERKGSYVRRAPRYAFSNRSSDIRQLFCKSCDALGIYWTQPTEHQIAIYRKTSVERLDEFVGPKR
jgi:hypothetical protein